jgi:hypothetical protein
MRDKHWCVRNMIDRVQCDIPSHQGIECTDCEPFITNDGRIEHNPDSCSQRDVVQLEIGS